MFNFFKKKQEVVGGTLHKLYNDKVRVDRVPVPGGIWKVYWMNPQKRFVPVDESETLDKALEKAKAYKRKK